MPTRVTCPKCQAGYNVRDDLVGKSLRCSACESVFAASPTAPASKRSTLRAPDGAARPARPTGVAAREEHGRPSPPPRKRPAADEDEERERPVRKGGIGVGLLVAAM